MPVLHTQSGIIRINGCSFPLMSCVSPCGRIPVCLTFNLLKDIWIVSTLRLLRIKLPETLAYRFLGECKSISLGWKSRSATAASYGIRMFTFFKKVPNCLPKRLAHSAFPPAINESSSFSTSSQAFGVVTIFYFNRYDKCVVLSHHGSNFQFTEG